MKQVILSAFFIFLSQTALSRSTEFGNGGNAVICSTYDGESVATYDLIESILRYGLFPNFPPMVSSDCQTQKNGREVCETGTDVARVILGRLEKVDPILMQDLLRKLDSFWSETSIVSADLTSVNDYGLGFLPEGCSLKQLAVQQEPIFAEDSRYFISSPLWQKLFNLDKAVLILHEIIYRYALEHNPGLNNSVKVRYFNALLISDKFKDLIQNEYKDIYFKVFKTDAKPVGPSKK
ncbi:hypothetical protein [Bdellovibrio sp. HCB274]|uniref:hypothetical protein n=1 Tax=Bdellovibrio sp. HCB274 TaxID=3394361 RepID=UPI0039B6CC54